MRMSIRQILKKKKLGAKIVMLTAYDYPTAYWLDQSSVDIILVGDSLANVVLGLNSTREVGMTEMLYHAKAVSRAVKRALVVGDMPYEAYQVNHANAVKNAKLFIKEAKCDAIKLEWFPKCTEVVKKIVGAGIPVMGHVGLTPQTADKLGGFKVQGKDALSAQKIIEQSIALQKAGCFSIVLECVPKEVSQIITKKLKIPTIGIGAGPFCDGQVLVIHDVLGLFERYQPKFVKRYAQLGQQILKSVNRLTKDIRDKKFPSDPYSFHMLAGEFQKLRGH